MSDAAPGNAAGQVDGGAVDGDFAAGDAAQSVGEGGDAGGDHPGVGNGDDVAGERFPVCLQEGGEVWPLYTSDGADDGRRGFVRAAAAREKATALREGALRDTLQASKQTS